MKILIIGGGGREHALAWKAAQSELVDLVYVAPGNAGTGLEDGVENVDIDAGDIDSLIKFAEVEKIGLTIVGPEAPLVAGIVDRVPELRRVANELAFACGIGRARHDEELAVDARRRADMVTLDVVRHRQRPRRPLVQA